MKKFMVSVVFRAGLALAASGLVASPASAEQPDMSNMGPLARKPTKLDKAGIEALWKASEEAWKKNDLEAAAALHDFPVYMATDNSKGEYMGGSWSKETWMKVMSATPMPEDMSFEYKLSPHFMSDTVAVVVAEVTMKKGKKKLGTFKNASIVVKKGGKWLHKGGVEAGWGDTPVPDAAKSK